MGIGFIRWEEPLGITEQCSLAGQVNTQSYSEEVRRKTEDVWGGGVGQGW